MLVHGLGLSGALWNRVARRASSPATARPRRPARRRPARASSSARSSRSSAGPTTSRPCSEALELERPAIVGHSLGASDRAQARARAARDASAALVLIGGEANLSNLAPRMLASAERIESMGLEAWVDEFWSKNPPFSDAVARARPVDARRVPGPAARERPRRLRPPVPRDRGRGEPGRPARRGDAAGARRHRRPRRPHAARARPRARRRAAERARSSSSRRPGTRSRSRRPRRRPTRSRAFLASSRPTPRDGRPASCAPTRRRATRGRARSATSTCAGSSAPQTGASLIAFGQSTYPYGATHENHHHPNAEEVVMVVSGRGTQIVGDGASTSAPATSASSRAAPRTGSWAPRRTRTS